MAALIVERRTDTGLKHVDLWQQKFEAARESGNLEHQTEAGISFRQTIVDAAHSTLFSHPSSSLLKMLHQQTRSGTIRIHQIEDPRPVLVVQHHTIFEAIAQVKPAEAAETARLHLDYVAHCTLQDREYQSRSGHADVLAQSDLKRVDWQPLKVIRPSGFLQMA